MKKSIRHLVTGLLAGSVLLVGACSPPAAPVANQTPLAIFTPSISTGAAPLVVNFDASASTDSDGTVTAYSWNFGDFTTASGVTTSHTFTNPGQYTVSLTVTDNAGGTGTSTTVITVTGTPITSPTGLQKTGSGCCATYGDFSWNPTPGATKYEISVAGYFGGGCLTTHSGQFDAPATTGRVQAVGLCLGSKYNVTIRAMFGGSWGPWSSPINITL
jgi:PKD repeat protein